MSLWIRNLISSNQITPRYKFVTPKLDFFISTNLRGWSVFTVKWWSYVVDDAKFEILGSNYLIFQVGVPIFFLATPRGRGEFTVNRWSDVVEDAKSKILESNYL